MQIAFRLNPIIERKFVFPFVRSKNEFSSVFHLKGEDQIHRCRKLLPLAIRVT